MQSAEFFHKLVVKVCKTLELLNFRSSGVGLWPLLSPPLDPSRHQTATMEDTKETPFFNLIKQLMITEILENLLDMVIAGRLIHREDQDII